MGVPILENLKGICMQWKERAKQSVRSPVFWAKAAGYGIPFVFLAYITYNNVLPFGYAKTFSLAIGSQTDTVASQLYIEPAPGLSPAATQENGTTYRNLEGAAKVIFKPIDTIKDASITAEVVSEGAVLLPPKINFQTSQVNWDQTWEFSKGLPKDFSNTNVFAFEDSAYFNGSGRLELPSSNDKFEEGPFTLYAEWMPIDNEGSGQQILGHFNWEIWQNANSIEFRVGRMNDANGPFFSIKYPVDKSFFRNKHSLIATYSPSDISGYMELFIDGKFVDRLQIGLNKIWKDYNGKNNLTLGFTPHNYGQSSYFKGHIYQIRYSSKPLDTRSFGKTSIEFLKSADDTTVVIPILSPVSSKIESVQLYVRK